MDDHAVLVGTGEGVHALAGAAPDAHAGRTVDHLVEADGNLWAIADGGLQAPGMGNGAPLVKVADGRANCLLSFDDDVLVGGSGARLYRFADGEVERVDSFDEAPGRASWYTPWGGPPDVRSMARGAEGNLYVNVHVGGVVRSTDGGRTWEDTMDIDADVHEVIADPERAGHAHVAAAIGLGTTRDGGATWDFTSDGLHASYCRAVATSARTVFVSASRGAGGRQAALYRRPLGDDGPLLRCTDGLPEWFSTNLNTFCLAARDRFVVAGDASGTVYVSRDDGLSWETATSSLPGINYLLIL